MKIYKRKSIFRADKFGVLLFCFAAFVVFTFLFTRILADEKAFQIENAIIILLFVLIAVGGVVAIYLQMNYIVITDCELVFVNGINPYRRRGYYISRLSSVVFDSQVSDAVVKGGRVRTVTPFVALYIDGRKIEHRFFMVDPKESLQIAEELRNRGVEVSFTAQFSLH